MTRFTPMLDGVEKFGREVIPLVNVQAADLSVRA